jgi:hypothetical protein
MRSRCVSQSGLLAFATQGITERYVFGRIFPRIEGDVQSWIAACGVHYGELCAELHGVAERAPGKYISQ